MYSCIFKTWSQITKSFLNFFYFQFLLNKFYWTISFLLLNWLLFVFMAKFSLSIHLLSIFTFDLTLCHYFFIFIFFFFYFHSFQLILFIFRNFSYFNFVIIFISPFRLFYSGSRTEWFWVFNNDFSLEFRVWFYK